MKAKVNINKSKRRPFALVAYKTLNKYRHLGIWGPVCWVRSSVLSYDSNLFAIIYAAGIEYVKFILFL